MERAFQAAAVPTGLRVYALFHFCFLGVLLLLTACGGQRQHSPKQTKPPATIILWAWDRAEDLRFLHPGEAEVAALMETIYLRNGRAESWGRKLPLLLPDGMNPIPVIRLESDGSELPSADSVASLLWRWIARSPRHLQTASSQQIQIDFDARSSQRTWYGELIPLLRKWKPWISITALASWCLENPWFSGVPDEAVPMLFQMGPRRNGILDRLYRQGHFADGCRDALGISSAELLPWRPEAKRVYIFNPQRWTREAFTRACARLR